MMSSADRLANFQRNHLLPLAGEKVLAHEPFLPTGGDARTAGGAIATLINPLAGAAVQVRQANRLRDQAIVDAATATSCAERFPQAALLAVVTPTRLVILDSHPVNGNPSMVLADYSLGEIESITAEKGSLMQRMSKLQFNDDTHVLLGSPRGGGYSPQVFLPRFAAIHATFQRQAESSR